jgi:hypothetical protein
MASRVAFLVGWLASHIFFLGRRLASRVSFMGAGLIKAVFMRGDMGSHATTRREPTDTTHA